MASTDNAIYAREFMSVDAAIPEEGALSQRLLTQLLGNVQIWPSRGPKYKNYTRDIASHGWLYAIYDRRFTSSQSFTYGVAQ